MKVEVLIIVDIFSNNNFCRHSFYFFTFTDKTFLYKILLYVVIQIKT